MAHLFNTEVSNSPLSNIRQTIRVEGGEVLFTVNTGKGSGEQTLSLDHFLPVVEVLEGYVRTGITRDTSSNPVDVVKRTISFDGEDSNISFRFHDGKGAKPIKLSLDQFGPVVSLLRQCADALNAVEGGSDTAE